MAPLWAKSHVVPDARRGPADSSPEICCLLERLGKFRHRPQLDATAPRRMGHLQHRSRIAPLHAARGVVAGGQSW